VNTPKAWLIDPLAQTVSPQEYDHIKPLIHEIVGPDAQALKLDNHDNVLWCSDIPTNSRFAYHLEMMGPPYCERRYNKGLIISLGSPAWDEETIRCYLRMSDNRQLFDISYEIKL
jgi:hypothetical protein